jgi:BirA family biotin operon repressor/biotin-[acetyl-CoA-carboxylase] ligase
MHPASDPPPLSLVEALAAVSARRARLGSPLVYLVETTSTNDVAGRLASEGAPEGTLVVAARQTRGRGRQGRTWFSPPGAGLYFSIVFRPDPAGARLLTLVAGVAAAEGIEQATGLAPDIKWPNDLVVAPQRPATGGPRKLAGILAESVVTADAVQHVVLGIGINVSESAYPPDLANRATSIEGQLGHDVRAEYVLSECVVALADRWAAATTGRKDEVLDAWRRRSPSAVGARVMVASPEGMVLGVTGGLSADGALRVDSDHGVLNVVAGEVTWL